MPRSKSQHHPLSSIPKSNAHATAASDNNQQPSKNLNKGARKWVPRNERRQFGYGLLPAGYAQMEAVGQVLKVR